jgi:outer membrane protein assembly factor BamB
VVVGSDLRRSDALAYVYAFDRETGALRWKTAAGPGAATDISTLAPLVYAVTLADEILALDVESGERVWSYATGEPNENFRMNSSPAVLGERVFFGGLDGVLYAFDAHSGGLLWKTKLGDRVSAGIVANVGGVYAGTSDGRLHRVVPETGAAAARIETAPAPNGRLVVTEECVLALLGDASLACYTPPLDRVRWTRSHSKPWTTSRPYAWRGLALAGDEAGDVFAFRLLDGEVAWSETVGGMIRGLGTSSGGYYAGTLKGMVHARPWPPAAGSSSPPP